VATGPEEAAVLIATIENLLNRGLPRSPRAQQLCAELAGRSVAIEIRDLTGVIVQSTGGTLKVTRPAGAADARISGGPLGLLALAGASGEAVLQRGEVRIEGDAEVAEKFRELGRLLRPDLEEELSLVLGDVPAHQLGRLARAAIGWTRKAGATTTRNLAEYLAHEKGDLVSRSEANQFLQGVDTLREDVDRLAARIDLLMQQPSAPSAEQRGT